MNSKWQFLTRTLIVVTCLWRGQSLYAAPADQPQSNWIMIDDQLNTWPIRLEEVFADRLFYKDVNGNDRNSRPEHVVAVLREQEDQPLSSAVVLATSNGPIRIAQKPTRWSGPFITLSDGQILTGRLLSSSQDGEILNWDTELLGRLSIPLEQAQFIHLHVLDAENRPEQADQVSVTTVAQHARRLLNDAGAGDVLELVNGDHLYGFLVGIEKEKVIFETDQVVEIPIARAANVLVRNPVARPAYDTCRVWMDPGMIVDVDCSRFLTDANALTVALPGGEDRAVAMSAIQAIAFHAGAVAPLAAASPTRIKPSPNGSGFSWFETPASPTVSRLNLPMHLGDLTIHGPVEVAYPIPDQVVRFGCRAEVPGEALEWADFELIVYAGDKELHRARFNRAHDRESILVDWPAGENELRLAITEGERGPIEDVIKLIRPMFLLAP